MVALIPARSGSKRILDKNIKDFFGHPLLAYTIRAAIDSKVFKHVYVSTDSHQYMKIAADYGVIPIRRPQWFAQDNSTDWAWVCHALMGAQCDSFAILRPTNPFRTADTIRRAWETFQKCGCPSMRGVEKVKQHPHKMWRWSENKTQLIPVLAPILSGFYNQPTQALCEVFAQNASMDMGLIEVLETGQITGKKIYPFFTEGYEGFDINTPEDWILAEELVKRGLAKLPEVKI